ncbi:MAG: hypothetical protein ACOH1L_08875 [Thermomonas sp.]
MPITRDQATRLLTQPEMGLFGDSRNPALRALAEKALASRVERTRKLRDKSRDLLQRQKLKSRERTGSKLGTSGVANVRTGKKGEILDDMLQRFETRLKQVQGAGEPVVKKKKLTAASTKPGKVAKTSVPAKASAKASRTPKAATTLSGKPARTAITPKRALKNTRALLDAKQQRDRQPPAYLAIDSHAGTEQPRPGFQSGAAKSKAQDLHEGEIRMEPIHGSISTQGRKNQGKRDNR